MLHFPVPMVAQSGTYVSLTFLFLRASCSSAVVWYLSWSSVAVAALDSLGRGRREEVVEAARIERGRRAREERRLGQGVRTGG